MLITIALAAGVRADQVVSGETNYPDAKITNFQQGQLQFIGGGGKSHSLWISDVDMIIVDRGGIFNDFNQAERFLAGGEPERAIIRYRRTQRLSEAFWSDLIATRLLVACDHAARIDHATLNFIRVVRGKWSGPAAGARLIPQNFPATRTPKALRAIEHLDAALAQEPSQDQRALLEMLRFKILSQTGDGRAASATKAVAVVDIPDPQRCERTYAIQLTALQQRSKEGLEAAEQASLDRAIRYCPETLLADFLLLKGRVLSQTAQTLDDMIRAAWPFMRIVAHMPGDARAAEGLYETALMLERMGRRDNAIDLLTECLAHENVRAKIRKGAEADLVRLQKAGPL
jgi:tetratricopeptide (TPR) repeat protein